MTGTRVLVVDDEPQILRALQMKLRGAGYAVDTASTAKEALMKAGMRPPEAIVLDLLLPDGRVLSAGNVFGGGSAEIYSPPYLFRGSRPTITSAPAGITYGQSFFVGTPDATSISQVTFIALGSVTHGFNMGQHMSRPLFSQATGGLNVTAPSNPNNTPPGLFRFPTITLR